MMLNSGLGDQAIDCFSDGDLLFPAHSVQLGCFKITVRRSQTVYGKMQKVGLRRFKILIAPEALQGFGKNDIRNTNRTLPIHHFMENSRGSASYSIKKIDPD
jgi:hypothetical protein